MPDAAAAEVDVCTVLLEYDSLHWAQLGYSLVIAAGE